MNSRASMFLKALSITAVLSVASSMTAQVARDVEMVPTGKGYGVAVEKSNNNNGQVKGNAQPGGQAGGNQCSNGICWRGGPVMTGVVPIHFIWYGNWGTNTAQNLLPQLVDDLSGSGYEHINTTYSVNGQAISGQMTLAGQGTGFLASGSKNLTDSDIKTIVANYAGATPDRNAIYFVLTSAEVNETSGFCTQYCGWHTHGSINGVDVKYSFVGNPDRCPNACNDQSTSPASIGNAGADGMASIIAHESEEAISDPDLNAWYDRRGAENADKCAWTFGSTSTAANGAIYNFTGKTGLQWLIQQNWVNANGGFCAMSF